MMHVLLLLGLTDLLQAMTRRYIAQESARLLQLDFHHRKEKPTRPTGPAALST